MGRKGEQDVFPYVVCQVHHVATFERFLHGEIWHGKRSTEVGKAADAFTLDLRSDLPMGPQPIITDPDLKRIGDWRNRLCPSGIRKIQDRAGLLSLVELPVI